MVRNQRFGVVSFVDDQIVRTIGFLLNVLLERGSIGLLGRDTLVAHIDIITIFDALLRS